jgi:phenylalanyl-tRNA synthetase beta chain
VEGEVAVGGDSYYHPGRKAVISAEGVKLATIGEIHPDIAENFDIETRVYVAEVDLDALRPMEKPLYGVKPLPKFPAVERDFAMLCDADLPVGTLEKAIIKGAGRLLERIELFDVYSGSQIPEGKKSVAYSVWLRSADSTLTDKEIETVSASIIGNLEKTGAELRK